MPPIPVVAETIVRFTMIHSTPVGRPADCIVDVSLDEFAGSRTTAVNTLVPLVVGAWQDKVCNNLWNAVTFTGARFLDIDTLTGHGGFQAPIPGKPTHGAAAGNMGSWNTALLVHKQCVHSRTERNGRMYIPGLAEVDYDDTGAVTTAVKNGWKTALDNFLGQINGGTFFPPASTAWRVVHVAGHAPDGRPNAWTSSDVDSIQIDAKVATQRRRLRG